MPARLQPATVFAALAMGAGLAMQASALAANTAPLPPGPWTKTLGPNAPAPTPADLFRPPTTQAPFDEAALREWLADVTKSPRKFTLDPPSGVTTIAGPSRLVPPLREGMALRILLGNSPTLRIVAWSGNRAVAIENEGQTGAHRWCGSVLTRPAADVPVDSRWLASTADARAFRCGGGGFVDLRYHDGAIILSRGEVRIIEVPLPAEPDEVLFEGSYALIGLELVRAVAPPPLPERPAVTTEWRPADIAWEGSGKDAVEKRADGSVRLAQAAAAAPAPTPLVATWKLPPPELGPREIVFKIDECGPGTGIYLASPGGQGGLFLGFVAPSPGGPPDRQGLLMTAFSPADKAPLTGGDPKNLGLNFVPRPVWLRLTVFDTTLVISWSGDGRNWARPRWFPRLNFLGGIGTVGLFVGGHPGAAIALTQLAAADLPGLGRILPRDLLPAVNPTLVTEGDPKRMAEWEAATLKAKPDGIDTTRWLAAAAIRCLATNRTNLTGGLKGIAWRHALAADFSLADRLDVCDDLNRLSTSFGNADAWVSTAPYCVLARACADRGDVDGFRTTWLRLMQAPSDIHYLWGFHEQVDMIGTRGRLVRRLLVTDPGGALRSELARQRYYEGAGYASGVALQLEAGGPVVFDADRRLSNVAREFAAAVAQEDWPDAQRTVARHLAESGAAAASQLIRHPDDPDRMVTLPVLVAAALRDHPAYRDALLGDTAERGRLRVALLRAAGDAEGMAVAAVEFAGAPPAAEAEEWLATRALAAGDVSAAREHAMAGRAWADADTAGRLVSIEALAEALGGAGVRTKPQAGLPDAAAADIAAVVAQAPARNPVAEPPPPPGDLEATKRLDLDASPAKEGYSSHADSLRNPIDERLYVFIAPPFFRQRLDWGAEVCTIAAAPGRLLVTNRLELVSLDPATAAVQWRLPPGPKPGGLDSLGPGLVAMRPCWDDRHAYLRRLAHGNAPTVAAVRLADGTVAWESPATAPHPPISDPVLVDGGLQFFEVRSGFIDELVFVVLDPATGARKRERHVGNLQPRWRVRRAKFDDKNIEAGDCQVTVADGRLYATIGGCVLCCQADGRTQWARHLPWLAADVDGWWRYQAQTPPLVHDGKVFLMQPGFPGIAAVDAADGRLLWKQPLEGPRRLVGIAGAGAAARLVVETADGILACDPRDGSTRMLLEARDGPGEFWLGIAPTRLVGPPLATADGHVIAMVQQRRADTAATNMLDVAVVWVDVATGAVQKTAEVPSLAGKPPWVGPLAVADGRLWTLAFANAADMRRALWELAPKPAP
jgi:outer membrane protein assembly factor BamB